MPNLLASPSRTERVKRGTSAQAAWTCSGRPGSPSWRSGRLSLPARDADWQSTGPERAESRATAQPNQMPEIPISRSDGPPGIACATPSHRGAQWRWTGRDGGLGSGRESEGPQDPPCSPSPYRPRSSKVGEIVRRASLGRCRTLARPQPAGRVDQRNARHTPLGGPMLEPGRGWSRRLTWLERRAIWAFQRFNRPQAIAPTRKMTPCRLRDRG